MKRIKCVLIVLMIMCFLIGCENPFIKNPHDYPNSVWISKSPYLEMRVDEDGMMESEFMIEGELENVYLAFKADRVVCFPTDGENAKAHIYANKYFLAECEYSKKKCVMKIIEKKEGILEGVDEIVLYNQKYVDKKK